MTTELYDEIGDLIADLQQLEDIIWDEVEALHAADLVRIQELAVEKDALMPALQRANSVMSALMARPDRPDLEDDPDVYDLAVTMMNLNHAATENERAVVASIRAAQFVVRTMVSALRADPSYHARYTSEGLPVYQPLSPGAGLANQDL